MPKERNFVFEKDAETTIYVHLFQQDEDEDRTICETCGKLNDVTMVRTRTLVDGSEKQKKLAYEMKTFHCVDCIIALADFLKKKLNEAEPVTA